MQRYGRIDVTEEAVINESNCTEQIYIRFHAPYRLNEKISFRAIVYFLGKLLFSGQVFSTPPSKMPSRTPMVTLSGGFRVGGARGKTKKGAL